MIELAMPHEQLVPYEPVISDDYLRSTEQVLPELQDLFRIGQVTVKPRSIENTPYYLNITHQKADEKGNEAVIMRLVNEDGHMINGLHTGCTMTFKVGGKEQIEIIGWIVNRSHRSFTQEHRPIRNISGVIAPYEDAVCMLLAEQHGPVLNYVKTNQLGSSTLVRNYIRRGYGIQPHEVAEKGWYLKRLFMPKSKKAEHSLVLH